MIAPGTFLSIFGRGFIEDPDAPPVLAPALPLPSELGGVSITIAGKPAPLLLLSHHQINAVAPFGLTSNQPAEIVIRRADGSSSSPVRLSVADTQPAIFSLSQDGQGQGAITDTAGNLVCGAGVDRCTRNPAKRGGYVTIYASGLGEVSPSIEAGAAAAADPLNHVTDSVQVLIDGQPAQVFFAGLTPGFASLYQINAVIPEDIEAGDHVPVSLVVGTQTSPTVTFAVE